MKLKLNKRAVVFLALFALFFKVGWAQDGFLPAEVKDISDRAYEPAMIELLDNAKESIDISMYNITPGENKRNPVSFLLKDLIEARQRGVSVTLYLNTKFDKKVKFADYLKELADAGCSINMAPKNIRLHDKLVIVDSRFVVEASTNWSISAFKSNRESATLIDSPELAKIKLLRLKTLYLKPQKEEKPQERPVYLENLPATLDISKSLFEARYFPRMLTVHDATCMDMYLLLLAHSQAAKKTEFFMDLEAMALSLGNKPQEAYKLRGNVIDNLRKLERQYRLLRVKLFHAKDAWVELKDLGNDHFSVNTITVLDQSAWQNVKFVVMLKALLEAQGEDIFAIPQKELARRFKVHRQTIGEGLNKMKKL